VLDGGGGRHAPSALPLGKTWYPSFRRLGGPQGWSGWVWNVLPPPGFDPQTVQPKVCCCTDWAIVWRSLPTCRLGYYWFIFTKMYLRCLLQCDYFHESLVFGKASLGWHHESHKVSCIYVRVFCSQTGGCVCIWCLFCFSYAAAAIAWQVGGPWLLVTLQWKLCYSFCYCKLYLFCAVGGGLKVVTQNDKNSVAYPGILFGGGGSTNSVEDRENEDLGTVAP